MITKNIKKKYYEKNKVKILKKLKAKYAKNKTFRGKVKKAYREKYHDDSDYAKATLKAANKRYANDPVYRAKTIKRSRLQSKLLAKISRLKKKKVVATLKPRIKGKVKKVVVGKRKAE